MFNVFAIAAAVLALAAPLGGPGQTSSSQTSASQTSAYWYVANHDGSHSAAVSEVPIGTPAGPVALRAIYVKTSGSSFTINLDDFGTREGLNVRIEIWGLSRLFDECVPVRSTRTITGTSSGRSIRIYIGEGQGGTDLTRCSGIATAGVMTLGGVKTP